MKRPNRKANRAAHAPAHELASLLFASRHKTQIADLIRAAYAEVPRTLKPRPPAAVQQATCSLTARGIGDCVVLTSILGSALRAGVERHCWVGLPLFFELMQFCPAYRETPDCPPRSLWLYDALRLVNEYDCGAGHITQQLQRAANVPISTLPRGALECPAPRRENRVILHFEPASGSQQMQRRLHERPRELYWQCKQELERFIALHSELEFIEVGVRSANLLGATHVAATNVSHLVHVIQSGAWFIGIMSGPLNLATALGLRCIVVCNIPSVQHLVLPTLRRRYTVEEEWQYPQNVHLHEDGGSALVPHFSLAALEAAFAGDVYPFWSHRWLDLLFEEEYA